MVRSLVRGSAVRTATDGRQALALLRERSVDLLLLDLLMPGTSGYDVLDALRTDPELGAPAVVVVTARGVDDEAVVAGALSVTRAGGLSVAEVMRWVRSGIEALQNPGSSAPTPRAALPA
jgi:CheY-like chemotaxis protein